MIPHKSWTEYYTVTGKGRRGISSDLEVHKVAWAWDEEKVESWGMMNCISAGWKKTHRKQNHNAHEGHDQCIWSLEWVSEKYGSLY